MVYAKLHMEQYHKSRIGQSFGQFHLVPHQSKNCPHTNGLLKTIQKAISLNARITDTSTSSRALLQVHIITVSLIPKIKHHLLQRHYELTNGILNALNPSTQENNILQKKHQYIKQDILRTVKHRIQIRI